MQLRNKLILYSSDICHQVLDLYSPEKEERRLKKEKANGPLQVSLKASGCEKPNKQKPAVCSTQIGNLLSSKDL